MTELERAIKILTNLKPERVSCTPESAGWESMDSAPENDQIILCYDKDGLYWVAFRDEQGKDEWIEDNAGTSVEAIAWQALPKIPNDRLWSRTRSASMGI